MTLPADRSSDARRIAVVNGLARDILYALRTLRRIDSIATLRTE
jgi:hypothetical protein